MIEQAMDEIEMLYRPKLFRHTALKNFLARSLAELNPDLSLQANTIDYYSEIFLKYIFDKASFSYWKTKNNRIDF
jgi:hypothetical protein